MKPVQRDVEFVGSQGHQLAGKLHLPAEKAKGSVLMAHCFTCSKDIHTMTRLADGMTEAGYATMRFDFTGRGESGGDFETKTLSGNVSDVTRAAATLIEMGYGPCAALGHSLGGAAVVLAAAKLKTVRSVITLGAPSDATHVSHLFSAQVDELRNEGRAEVCISGRSFYLQKQFLDDLETHDILSTAAALNRPHLVIHTRDDDVVGFDNGEALYAAAGDHGQMLALDTGGHLLEPRPAAEAALTAVVEFLDANA
jgi:fermentation-respiration switch protein FrsA (DUF1100 family)